MSDTSTVRRGWMSYRGDNLNWWQHFLGSLKYALYCPIHPFDGFWDLTHEKRGSLGAANLLVVLMIVVELMRSTLTNFQFIDINMEKFNAIMVVLSILLPLILWTVANWGLTTLMDGKGKLFDIYMATAYALTPYIIICAICTLLSQFITSQEGSVYYFLMGFAMVWSVLLVLAAMMQIHDYSAAKAIGSSLLTIVGVGVMVFIFLMFFSLISDAFAYFVSLYKEIVFRVT
jgi:hypothetical protein